MDGLEWEKYICRRFVAIARFSSEPTRAVATCLAPSLGVYVTFRGWAVLGWLLAMRENDTDMSFVFDDITCAERTGSFALFELNSESSQNPPSSDHARWRRECSRHGSYG